MRSVVRRHSRHSARGGWMLLEWLRECGYVAAIVAIAVAVLNQFVPYRQTEEAAAVLAAVQPVYSLNIGQDGEQMWVNRHCSGLTLWDLGSAEEVGGITYRDGRLFDVDVGGNNEPMLAMTIDQARLRLVKGDEIVGEFEWSLGDGTLNDVRVARDGQSAVVVSSKGHVATWTWNGHHFQSTTARVEGAISNLALSADGRWAVLVVDNENLALFDRIEHREVKQWRAHNHHIAALEFSPDGRWIASGGKDGFVRLWDRATGEKVWEAAADMLSPCAVRFSVDGRLLATGGFDKVVCLWNVANGTLATTLSAHSGPIRALAFHPDGERLYSGGLDGNLFEWSLASQSVLRNLH